MFARQPSIISGTYRFQTLFLLPMLIGGLVSLATAEPPALATHPTNVWIKRTPLPEAPVSPRLGYEGACVWDRRNQLLVRYGGHNQGGGGEQGAEVWTFDLATAKWTLKEPNTSPPGVCCNAQNVYDPTSGRYVRFPFFSGSHGWQWARELSLNDSSVWTYDLGENRWRNRRPLPTPRLTPYRCASWDSDEQLVVVFGGEGSHEGTLLYDPARNEWRWPKPANEPAARSGGNMAYDEARKLHVLFGSQFDNDVHTWAYDARRNEWRDMKPEVQPPTDKNDAVLTYDPIHRVVLAIIKITTGKDESATHELQTWAYDAGANRWQRMNPTAEPTSSSNRARNLIFAPELNLAILENCTSKPREQQVWTYRFGEAPTGQTPLPVAKPRTELPLVEDGVVSVIGSQRVEIRWTAPVDPSLRDGKSASRSDAATMRYHVERAVVEVYSDDQLKRLKSRTPPLAEPIVGAILRIGPFLRLTTEPLKTTSFVDTKINLNEPHAIDGDPSYDRPLHKEHLDESGREYRKAVFAYRIRSVNDAGKESGPSPALFTVPSSPQHVFSREDGTICQLKWSPNPERGISGYRVYRMDGRYDKDPVSRLTSEPIMDTTFKDESAGKQARRYYIIAVDALGQEGFPSSPVWFQREWRDFYLPFIGDWHQ
ncbi:MAG: hypothetical protein IAG10_13635 [Planctomycetaceae bacterium]|nr:hypothetical protein [Planctomycetaceae bacterium]